MLVPSAVASTISSACLRSAFSRATQASEVGPGVGDRRVAGGDRHRFQCCWAIAPYWFTFTCLAPSCETRLLLDALRGAGTLECYVPADVSEPALLAAADALTAGYPGLDVRPVVSDFEEHLGLPGPGDSPAPRLVAFLGGTIGNLLPAIGHWFDVLFLGGSTAWKLGSAARRLTTEAKARGKQVHMGRVNSLKRLMLRGRDRLRLRRRHLPDPRPGHQPAQAPGLAQGSQRPGTAVEGSMTACQRCRCADQSDSSVTR